MEGCAGLRRFWFAAPVYFWPCRTPPLPCTRHDISFIMLSQEEPRALGVNFSQLFPSSSEGTNLRRIHSFFDFTALRRAGRTLHACGFYFRVTDVKITPCFYLLVYPDVTDTGRHIQTTTTTLSHTFLYRQCIYTIIRFKSKVGHNFIPSLLQWRSGAGVVYLRVSSTIHYSVINLLLIAGLERHLWDFPVNSGSPDLFNPFQTTVIIFLFCLSLSFFFLLLFPATAHLIFLFFPCRQ